MEMLVLRQSKPHASHHGFPLFLLPNPTLTSISKPSNWTFDDDINWVLDDEVAPAHGEEVGGEGVSGGDVGPSGVAPSGDGGSDIFSGSGGVPLEEEEYTPPLTWSCTAAGSTGFDATHFY